MSSSQWQRSDAHNFHDVREPRQTRSTEPARPCRSDGSIGRAACARPTEPYKIFTRSFGRGLVCSQTILFHHPDKQLLIGLTMNFFFSRTLMIAAALTIIVSAAASQKRDLLTGSYSLLEIQKILQSRSQWHPFPSASERARWQKLPEALRNAYLKKGEEALLFKWPSLPATLYLDYARTGNRENYQRPYFERRQKIQDLILAECVEGKGRFLDQIMNGLWLLAEETSWVIPAHVKTLQRGNDLPNKRTQVVDLFAAETGTLYAWAYYLLGDQLGRMSPLLPQRIMDEMNARILVPNLERDDFWWMWSDAEKDTSHSINNWTPWICSNWLAATLLMEQNAENRTKSVYKIMKTLDRFLNSYPADGGCDEGPSYWGRAGGSLFECLELLESASNGGIDVYSKPLVQEIGRYIYRAHIHDFYYVNFSDAPAKVNVQSDLVLRYGHKIQDRNLAQLGAYSARLQRIAESGVGGSLSRELLYLFNLDLIDKYEAKEPLLKDVWLPETRFVAAREQSGSTDGFYLAAQGLHNGKSHNHNDVGNFVLYADGEPLIIDVGVETYTAKTFSSDRYNIWTMQSAYHNLPTINGVMQKDGRQYAARNVQYQNWPDSVRFALDIAAAYPSEAGIQSWLRTIKMDRKVGTVQVKEDYSLNSAAKEITLTLITPCEVSEREHGRLILSMQKRKEGESLKEISIRFDPGKLKPHVEVIPINDNQLKRVWGGVLRRVIFTVQDQQQRGSVEINFTRSSREN